MDAQTRAPHTLQEIALRLVVKLPEGTELPPLIRRMVEHRRSRQQFDVVLGELLIEAVWQSEYDFRDELPPEALLPPCPGRPGSWPPTLRTTI